jgi:Methyltransferase domain
MARHPYSDGASQVPPTLAYGRQRCARQAPQHIPITSLQGLQELTSRTVRRAIESMKGRRRTLNALFEQYSILLEKVVNGCDTVLDVGCGAQSPLRHLTHRPKVLLGVDSCGPVIKRSEKAGIHDTYWQIPALDVDKYFDCQSLDCVVALDLIEHLTKEDGSRLLASMERIARKRVVVFTPNGFLPQAPYEGNPSQEHLSGWSVDEMRARGYEVTGVNGWKPLRGQHADGRFRPRKLWRAVSILTRPLVVNHPGQAFQILCVKNLSQSTR